jgi:opacity protein-like surface antigen
MKKIILCLMGLTALGLGLWPAAQAAPMKGKAAVFGNFGYAMYAMDDFNKIIVEPSSGTLDKITGGLTLGGGAQYGLFENILAGLEIQYLMAGEKKDLATHLGTATIDISAPLLEMGLFVKGALPANKMLWLTGGLGVNYLSSSGSIQTTLGTTQEEKMNGSGVGYKIIVGGEAFVSEKISIGLDLGYRIAKIGEVKDADGNILLKPEGGNFTMDYSGGFGQLGVKVYF